MGVTYVDFKPRLQLQVTLLLGQVTHISQALLDSGAEKSLIDRELAKQLHIPLFESNPPNPAKAPNNQVFSHITHCTAPITIVTSGNHRITLRFYIFQSADTAINLGFPWPKVHIPYLDWVGQKLISWSLVCYANCLISAPAPEAVEPSPQSNTAADLSSIPSVHHDLQELFSKKRAFSLSPHRPYDCAIELLPGSTLPLKR